MDGDEGGSRHSLLDQASQFLLHDDIRDAPRERKVTFLESKGLRPAEIDELLDVLSATDPNTDASPDAPLDTPSPATPSVPAAPNADASRAAPSSAPEPALDSSSSSEPPSPAAPAPSTTESSSQPPIITYPEFLARAHAARPPPRPLLSHPAVAPALYISAVLGASAHALSTFVLRPMHDALTAARGELFGTAQKNLDELNAKLEEAVSVVPALPKPAGTASGEGRRRRRREGSNWEEEEDEDEDEDADPTELFHRDVGVQTESAPPSPDSAAAGATAPAVQVHEARLERLHAHAAELQDSDASEAAEEKGARDRVDELRMYLDRLAIGQGVRVQEGRLVEQGPDEVAKVKAEIRSVKGVLLNARSFPRVAERAGAFAGR